MASGAGLNRVGTSGGVVLLSLNPSSAAYATPRTGYGVDSNDSGSVGPMIVEATGFTKIGFALVPSQGSTTFSGYTVTILVTIDTRAYGQWRASIDPMAYYGVVGGPPVVPAGSWTIPQASSEQTGSGNDANPMTFTNPSLTISRPILAVRAVLTAVSSPSGNCDVIAFAVP